MKVPAVTIKAFKKLLKKNIKFHVDFWHVQFYNRKGQLMWTNSKRLLVGSVGSIVDLRVAFGHLFPHFTQVPRGFGKDNGIRLICDYGTFLLFKTDKNGIPE